MSDILQPIAADFASDVEALHGISHPADEYFDPLSEVLGDKPTKESLIESLSTSVPELTAVSDWIEHPLSETDIGGMLHRAILNHFGKDVEL